MSQVYFVHAPSVHLIKIGRSVDPERRLEELRLISPVPLEVMGIIDGGSTEESYLHHRFAHLHAHGEWFHATEELKNYAWVETLICIWGKTSEEARQQFREYINTSAQIDRDRRGAA